VKLRTNIAKPVDLQAQDDRQEVFWEKVAVTQKIAQVVELPGKDNNE
jgi:hypothetical protein